MDNCKGCYALGTACGKCNRCAEERKSMQENLINDTGWLKKFKDICEGNQFLVTESEIKLFLEQWISDNSDGTKIITLTLFCVDLVEFLNKNNRVESAYGKQK